MKWPTGSPGPSLPNPAPIVSPVTAWRQGRPHPRPRAEDGDPSLAGLSGLVLVSGSPPSPEPIPDDRRSQMLSWIDADPETRAREARTFVQANVGGVLPSDLENLATDDVLRAAPAAWKAWLNSGAHEDLCRRVGVLRTPALVCAGSEDADLGPDAQAALTCPTSPTATSPPSMASATCSRSNSRTHSRGRSSIMRQASRAPRSPARDSPGLRRLDRQRPVNSRLRSALNERAAADDPAYTPQALDPVELAILRAVFARVLPVAGLDVAARVDARLATGRGDGWRFMALPADDKAYPAALRTLDAAARATHERPFVVLAGDRQDALLTLAQKGELTVPPSLVGGSTPTGCDSGSRMPGRCRPPLPVPPGRPRAARLFRHRGGGRRPRSHRPGPAGLCQYEPRYAEPWEPEPWEPEPWKPLAEESAR